MVRGGGDTEGDTDGESDVYDLSSSGNESESDESDESEEVESSDDGSDGDTDTDGSVGTDAGESSPEKEEAAGDGEIPTPSPEAIENATQSLQLSSQARNFAIATTLWASLFFDGILNKAKRATLFPVLDAAGAVSTTATVTAAPSLAATAAPTALLAAGFALAGGVSFLLWRDMEIGAEMLGAEDGGSDKGDRFLALSSPTNGRWEDEGGIQKFASEARARLSFHLSLFGALCLAAHGGFYFSDQAPFLGVSAAIINVHNTLACIGALMKEEGAKEWMARAVTWPLRLFRRDGKVGGRGKQRPEFASFVFRLAAGMAGLRCFRVGQRAVGLVLQGALLAAAPGPKDAAVINHARLLSLEVASLARLSLFAGVSQLLHASASTAQRNNEVRNHPFFSALSGGLGVGAVGVGGILLVDSLRSTLAKVHGAAGGALLVIFGLFAGYHSVMGVTAQSKARRRA